MNYHNPDPIADAWARAAATNPPESPDVSEVVSPSPPLAPIKPFPVSDLPDPLRKFVAEGAAAIGCDPAYLALPLLAGAASAIGNTRRIQLKRSWTEGAIVWTGVVGESGTTKSPAIELALAPIRTRQEDALAVHSDQMAEYADTLARYERDLGAWKRSKADTSPPCKPAQPVADRCWTDDTTVEALAVLLRDNPRGVVMIRDELAGWFAFDRYAGGRGGGDAAKWLEMFGGRPMSVDRKGGGHLYVPRAAVSIAGGIQPATLRRALSREYRDNGLAARLLLAYPARVPKAWTEAEIDPATDRELASMFGRLFSLNFETDQWGKQRPIILPLDEGGKAEWVKFYNAHGREQHRLEGDLAAVWSKLEGYAARFALVMHLVRAVTGDPTLTDPDRVDAISVEIGINLSRWFGEEARRIYSMLDESEADETTRRLRDWIAAQGGPVTARDVTRGPRAYRDHSKAEAALAQLVAVGMGRWVPIYHPEGGRPTDGFRLWSAGDGDETPRVPA